MIWQVTKKDPWGKNRRWTYTRDRLLSVTHIGGNCPSYPYIISYDGEVLLSEDLEACGSPQLANTFHKLKLAQEIALIYHNWRTNK